MALSATLIDWPSEDLSIFAGLPTSACLSKIPTASSESAYTFNAWLFESGPKRPDSAIQWRTHCVDSSKSPKLCNANQTGKFALYTWKWPPKTCFWFFTWRFRTFHMNTLGDQLAARLLGFDPKTIWFLHFVWNQNHWGGKSETLDDSVTLWPYHFGCAPKDRLQVALAFDAQRNLIEDSFNRTWVDIKINWQPGAILRKMLHHQLKSLWELLKTAVWIQKLPNMTKYRTQAQYVNYSRHDPSIKQWIYTLIRFSQWSCWSHAQKIASRVAKEFIDILLPFAVENSLDEQERWGPAIVACSFTGNHRNEAPESTSHQSQSTGFHESSEVVGTWSSTSFTGWLAHSEVVWTAQTKQVLVVEVSGKRFTSKKPVNATLVLSITFIFAFSPLLPLLPGVFSLASWIGFLLAVTAKMTSFTKVPENLVLLPMWSQYLCLLHSNPCWPYLYLLCLLCLSPLPFP